MLREKPGEMKEMCVVEEDVVSEKASRENSAMVELEKLLSLNDAALETATWKISGENEWVSAVNRMQKNWKQLRKQKRRVVKSSPEAEGSNEPWFLDEITSCRYNRNNSVDKIAGTGFYFLSLFGIVAVWNWRRLRVV